MALHREDAEEAGHSPALLDKIEKMADKINRANAKKGSPTDGPFRIFLVEAKSASGRALQEAVGAMGKVFGTEAVLIHTTGGLTEYGYRGLTNLGGVLLIDVGSLTSAFEIAGHEILHNMREDRPELYKALVDSGVLGEPTKGYVKEKSRFYAKADIPEEHIADHVGTFFSDPGGVRPADATLPSQVRAGRLRLPGTPPDLY